jgi:tripeptide aminopeptidase
MKKLKESLLLDIFRIGSMSQYEEKQIAYIENFLESRKIPFTVDQMGNIYCFEYENRPILNAHMDTVQDEYDDFLSKYARIKDGILKSYGVLGGDDKCGIYIILHLLDEGEKFNFIFTVQEEIGTVGARFVEKELGDELRKFPYLITIDRKGNGDIICEKNDYGTKEYEKALEEVGKDFGFKATHGVLCDSDVFSNKLSCCNLSSGYYNPHSKKEFVVLEDLLNTLMFVKEFINKVDTKFEAPNKKVYKGYLSSTYSKKNYSGGYGYGYGYDDDEVYDDYCKVTCKITNKKFEYTEVKYISCLEGYVSLEGARKLLTEFDKKGLLSDGVYIEDSIEEDDIEKAFEELF